MKLRLSYARTGRADADLAVTCDATATVGDLPHHLYVADPRNAAQPDELPRLTIAVAGGRQPEVLEPLTIVAEGGLRTGQRVMLAQAGERYRGQVTEAAAIVEIVAGPDHGKQFHLMSGSNTVGRARDNQVVLTDGLVSRQHLRVNVTDVAEVIDLGSANGVQVNDGPVDRAPLRPGDRVAIGDTQFTVRVLRAAAVEGRLESPPRSRVRWQDGNPEPGTNDGCPTGRDRA